ncbi:hypothetical protein AVEN_253258-1 [Araneus ventricosus]|uniref:Uncharacterized protein n=1 Tax=Araneus ventricosus TaxID=182803 RepID=A0A4Y2U6M0_ARAVE|nr:hypothetical protein AVEN_253258-1 [Araneus ventricosus]
MLGRESYRGKHGMTGRGQAWTPDLGDHFEDLATSATNRRDCRKCDYFLDTSIRRGDTRMYEIIQCDVTASRARVYKRRQPKGGMTSEFRPQSFLESQ